MGDPNRTFLRGTGREIPLENVSNDTLGALAGNTSVEVRATGLFTAAAYSTRFQFLGWPKRFCIFHSPLADRARLSSCEGDYFTPKGEYFMPPSMKASWVGSIETVSSHRCLDLYVGWFSFGEVSLKPCHGGENQQWAKNGDRFKSLHDGRCLTAVGAYSGTSRRRRMGNYESGDLFVKDCNGGQEQRFVFPSEDDNVDDDDWI